IISPGRNKEKVAQLVRENLKTIENFRFIYKQDIITPKIITAYLDKQSKPHTNILEELMNQISNLDERNNAKDQ
ncbi:hypothetical protein K6A00_001860, partial [Campylobacter coli]|nr:hypothetical protein [Campylobacter coli]